MLLTRPRRRPSGMERPRLPTGPTGAHPGRGL